MVLSNLQRSVRERIATRLVEARAQYRQKVLSFITNITAAAAKGRKISALKIGNPSLNSN